MGKKLRFFSFVISLLTFLQASYLGEVYAQSVIVFGSETFIRSSEAPETFVRSFPLNLPLQNFTISVQNGEGRHGRVSSAVVFLNGVEILGPNNFNQQVDLITRSITLQA
jgi:hypothetical protein